MFATGRAHHFWKRRVWVRKVSFWVPAHGVRSCRLPPRPKFHTIPKNMNALCRLSCSYLWAEGVDFVLRWRVSDFFVHDYGDSRWLFVPVKVNSCVSFVWAITEGKNWLSANRATTAGPGFGSLGSKGQSLAPYILHCRPLCAWSAFDRVEWEP